LVLASVFVLGKKIAWTPAKFGSLSLGTVFGWLVVTLVPMEMPGGPAYMFGYGTVAISAMLLPGISGSFILLILGQYERVIGALESLLHLDFSALLIVVPFALGCLFGLAAFSRVVAWLLRRFHDPVVAGLCGLLLGSLWRIWPYQDTVTREVRGKVKVIEATPYLPDSWDPAVFILLVLGFAAVFLVEFLAGMRKKSAPSLSSG
jgi:putative membrane protein